MPHRRLKKNSSRIGIRSLSRFYFVDFNLQNIQRFGLKTFEYFIRIGTKLSYDAPLYTPTKYIMFVVKAKLSMQKQLFRCAQMAFVHIESSETDPKYDLFRSVDQENLENRSTPIEVYVLNILQLVCSQNSLYSTYLQTYKYKQYLQIVTKSRGHKGLLKRLKSQT